ncbi:MAG: hypothetical protein L3J69_03570 [Desulfobacula sp.]|nr:hypothetical protein [Desulfobacula sp.]
MVNTIKTIVIFFGIYFLFVQSAAANDKVLTHVKVIHASTASHHIDPGLKNISSELQSVFKYTSYRLLKKKSMSLGFNQKGRVDLPGKRTLTVEPLNIDGNRIRYQINIRKNKKKIFQTKVLLKNNRSITIGGPQFKKGVLIFNISGSVQ